ncbi:MAG: GTP 3',8-cyclase MoaA [Pseudomonadota bacterium]
MLIDSFQRHISYLRLSLTDRCNLRCRYCMPEQGVKKLGHDEILSYEEFLTAARAAAAEGMTKIRLTGGEPLVRKGILEFIEKLAAIPGIMDLRLTTNGVLLGPMARDLLRAGIKRVNVSLDSLDPRTFEYISGRNEFNRVWAGLEKALEAGFDLIKVNCVPIRGINDHEIEAFARLSLEKPIEVRFIEFMPLGRHCFWSPDRITPTAEIKKRLAAMGELTPEPHRASEGPANVFRLPQAQGSVGFISPMTDHFCGTCNRLRLTADGKLRLCLLSELEMDLKPLLRSGAGLEEISAFLRDAVKLKPGAHLLSEELPVVSGREMNLIGG